MKIAVTILASAVCATASAQTASWSFATSTGGENIMWVSQTAVDPQADQYDYVHDITYVAVDVIFLGQILGPYDVSAGHGMYTGVTAIVPFI